MLTYHYWMELALRGAFEILALAMQPFLHDLLPVRVISGEYKLRIRVAVREKDKSDIINFLPANALYPELGEFVSSGRLRVLLSARLADRLTDSASKSYDAFH